MSCLSTSRRFTHALATSRRARSLLLRLAALVAWQCAALLVVPQAHAGDLPTGIYSLTPPGKPAHAAILTHPNVAGVVLRGQWQEVAPSEGVYDWSYFDTELARMTNADKAVLLRITAGGRNTPSWVLEAGAQTFSFLDTNPYSTTYGETLTIPVFWDPIFLEKKKAFIAAMGGHFAAPRVFLKRKRPPLTAIGQRLAANGMITLVSTACANATTSDWHVPHSEADIAQWLALGYTSEKVIQACKETIDATMTAFPHQHILMAIGRTSKHLDPNPDYVARAVIEYAKARYPDRFIVQKNSLAATTPDPTVTTKLGNWQLVLENRPLVGGQMLWFVTDDDTCHMNGQITPCDPATVLRQAVTIGGHYGMQYQEIYQEDILNSNLADVIGEAASMLSQE
jgi:hypothetical protein